MTELYDIGWAVKQLKDGRTVRRREWKWGTFIALMPQLQLPPYNTQDTEQKVNYPTARFIGEDEPLNGYPYTSQLQQAKGV